MCVLCAPVLASARRLAQHKDNQILLEMLIEFIVRHRMGEQQPHRAPITTLHLFRPKEIPFDVRVLCDGVQVSSTIFVAMKEENSDDEDGDDNNNGTMATTASCALLSMVC